MVMAVVPASSPVPADRTAIVAAQTHIATHLPCLTVTRNIKISQTHCIGTGQVPGSAPSSLGVPMTATTTAVSVMSRQPISG